MKLKELLKNVHPLSIVGNDEADITGVNIDSRKIAAGHLFVAIKGTQTDGHRFIPKALELGATAVLCEDLPEVLQEGVTYVQVASTEEAVGPVATVFYGEPSQHLKLVGVTGTNGKTTIATLLYHMFRKFGHRCGLLSTVCNYIEDKAIPADHTTPDPIALNELLHQMVEAECEYAFMECSSHAIAQKRIGGLKFAGGLFTNLTRDHLDYHKTFENYRDAKKAFFDGLPKEAFAVTNADDKNGMVMVQNCKAQVKTYSTRNLADFKGQIVEEGFDGMLLNINGQEVFVHLVGRFNLSNLLCIYGAAVCLGFEPLEVLRILSTLQPVNGRFETIRSPKGWTAIVDYAHTPDAVENVIKTINEIKRGRLITVVGCGGNRDKGKRPMMAQIAYKGSEQLILTSDNPRDEEPQAILKDMTDGLREEELRTTLVIEDRAAAIQTACTLARKDDVILIAGKGHEDYQEVKGVKHHFDDREVVRETFSLDNFIIGQLDH